MNCTLDGLAGTCGRVPPWAGAATTIITTATASSSIPAAPVPPARVRVLSVHFAPGARTAWHRHPFGQVLHVSEGAGLVQSRGGEPEAIRAGDTVQAAAGEWHWHGAGPGTFMTHLAVQETGADGQSTEWGDHVSDDEYRP